jgi:hypothetical protein
MNVCPFLPSYHLYSTRPVQMPETQLDEGLSRAQGKRKTTYPRNHPTGNPRLPKRTKAEIQLAAKEKKDAEHAKKVAAEAQKRQKLFEAEEKRKLSAQRIAAVEDAVRRSQKQRQSRSERPDLKTMEAYRERLQRQKELEPEIEPIANEEEVDELAGNDMYIDRPQFPPESTVDTDSDGARLGLSKSNMKMMMTVRRTSCLETVMKTMKTMTMEMRLRIRWCCCKRTDKNGWRKRRKRRSVLGHRSDWKELTILKRLGGGKTPGRGSSTSPSGPNGICPS